MDTETRKAPYTDTLRNLLVGSEAAVLVLEDGSHFPGRAIGVRGSTSGEIVFNTSMTGYQEIISDPSYAEQLICFSYPHIGNTGTNRHDYESRTVWTKGIVVHSRPGSPENWRSESSLENFLQKHSLVGIAEVNTRALIRHIRSKGVLKACIVPAAEADTAKDIIHNTPSMNGRNLVSKVSTETVYTWTSGGWNGNSYSDYPDKHFKKHVAVYDFGVKHAILRSLADIGCRLTVVPSHKPAQEVMALDIDGVVLSNGPGDPRACTAIINNIRELLQYRIPILGICLGHQLAALACGAEIFKMKFGHHGANHPVLDLEKNTVHITAQNHGYAVSADNLPDCLRTTCTSLFDSSLQGLRHNTLPLLGIQGHPEASPGPQDMRDYFNLFYTEMERSKCRQEKT